MQADLVEIIDTHSARGMGLFAKRQIASGRWLGEYTGEVLTHEQYLERYPNEDAAYVLAANTDWNIDAADPRHSSFLRYVNHSSSFNCLYEVRKVKKRRDKSVHFYAAFDVAAGEELTFDYGKSYWSDRGEAPIQ